MPRERLRDELSDRRVGEARRTNVRSAVARRRIEVPGDARLEALGALTGGEAEARHHRGAIAKIARGLLEAMRRTAGRAQEVGFQPGKAHPASILASVGRLARRRVILAASVITSLCAVVGARVRRARADGAGVVVVPASRSAAAASDVARAMASAAEADPDAVGKARRARAAGAVPAQELSGFAQVARLEAEGWRAYQVAVDVEFAASRLASARSQAETLLALPGGVEVYAEVSLRLGLVLAHLGRRDEAAEALRLARALDPERAVTTAEFSPDGVAVFDAAIAARPPVASVTITATGRAMLSVDGAEIGRSPQTVSLAHGQHVVVARARGRVPRGMAVSIDAGTREVEVTLEHAPAGDALERDEALAAGAGEDEATAAVADTLVYAELDEVYVVSSVFRSGAPALLGQRCTLARPACTAVVEIGHIDGGLEAAARTLVERLRAATPRYGVILPRDARVASGERGGGKGDGRCTWCRNPWVIGGAGVVAAALITGAAIALTRDDPAPIVTVDPGDFTE